MLCHDDVGLFRRADQSPVGVCHWHPRDIRRQPHLARVEETPLFRGRRFLEYVSIYLRIASRQFRRGAFLSPNVCRLAANDLLWSAGGTVGSRGLFWDELHCPWYVEAALFFWCRRRECRRSDQKRS